MSKMMSKLMSNLMSNLMSEFREKIAVQFAYIGCRNIRAIRSIDIVGYAAPAGVSHVCLTILFGYAQDVEICCKCMPESVSRHLIIDAEFLAKPLQPFTESFEVEVEHFTGK